MVTWGIAVTPSKRNPPSGSREDAAREDGVPGLGLPAASVSEPFSEGHPGTGWGSRCGFVGVARRGRFGRADPGAKPREYSGAGRVAANQGLPEPARDGLDVQPGGQMGDNRPMAIQLKTPQD